LKASRLIKFTSSLSQRRPAFNHSFVETRKVGPGIDRLDLNSEGFQLLVHRFSDRLHGMLARGICGNRRDSEESNN
jgi:hypothetical protein